MSHAWKRVAYAAIGVCVGMPVLLAAEIVIFSFEGSPEDWAIPDWAKTSGDYAAEGIAVSNEQAKDGEGALEIQAAFPGERWTGVYVERLLDVTDWSAFGQLSASVYLPAQAPAGLKGRLILTVGDEWKWTEMNRAIPLTPGTWTTITANLKPGSMDWSFFPDDTFRQDVRKMGVRIESNPLSYRGPIYIDDVRLAE